MGADVVLHAAGLLGDRIAAALWWTPLSHGFTSPEAHARTGRIFGKPFAYASRVEATKRFRVVPPQPTLAFVHDHIAARSVRETPNGWSWKYDPRIFTADRGAVSRTSDISCPLALVLPEHGIAGERKARALIAQVNGPAQIVLIPAAAHHVMLDEPLSLVTPLRALLSAPPWTA